MNTDKPLRPTRPGDAFVLAEVGFCAVQHVVLGKVLFAVEGGRATGWTPGPFAAHLVATLEQDPLVKVTEGRELL